MRSSIVGLTVRFQSSAMKVLCVAEKPSIAKAVAGHLSGGQFQVVRNIQFPAIIVDSSVKGIHLLMLSPRSTRRRSTSKTMFLIMTSASLGGSAMSP